MNKTKRPMNNRLAKKIKKEVHSAQAKPATQKIADELTEKELKKRYPTRKAPSKTKAVKRPVAPKKKVGSKLSKRSTPGSVSTVSSPANSRREGAVWNQTVIKQSLNKSKTLAKKMSKRK